MSGDDEATRLPHAVHIKTPTRTFNLFFYFALDDAGRIWVKSIPGASRRTDAFAPDWCLFLGTGLPHDGTRADFAAPRRIDLINADLDELMAVSDLHRLYTVRWFENPVFAEPTRARTWADLHGRPNPAPLRWDAHVEHNRGYAIGRRTRSFALFEDIARRTFDGGGGLSTYYILRGDGTSIAYFDPGLPADFSHTIGGPDRSTFVAEAMAVSGDTIFVINAYGEPRTRTMDFAGDGSDTMFLVDRQDRGARSEAATSAACAWATHSSIPLEGQAQIASQLAIVPTGQHLCDRELRVAGYDRDRRSGYYFQRICDPGLDEPPREDWCFVPDESVVLDPACLLDPADTDPSAVRSVARVPLPTRWPNAARPPRRVAPRNMWFTGALWVDDQRLEVRAELLDFHFDWSPARFRLTAGKASRESIEVTLHTAEQWASRRRCDPGHDGTPKAIRATLELSTAAFATDQPILRALVGDVLARYHLVAFAWLVQATEHELRIESKPARQTVPAWPRVALHLVRAHRSYASSAAPPSAPRDECFTAAARAPALRIGRPLGELTSADATALVAKISHNLYAASTMITAAAAPVRQDVAEPSWLQHSVLGAQRYAARPWLPATALPLLPFRSVSASEAARYAKNVATVLPRLLARNRELKDDLLNRTRQDLAHALMLIDTRTAAYTWRLAQLAGTTTARPFSYFEDLAGFWSLLRFGRARLDQLPWLDKAYTCAASVRDDELFVPPPAEPACRPSPPGIIIDVDCHAEVADRECSSAVALRITPTHLERDFFQASIHATAPVGSAANPFRTAVEVRIDHADRTPATSAVLDGIFHSFHSAADPRDSRASAELSIAGDRYRVTGDGFTLAWRAGD